MIGYLSEIQPYPPDLSTCTPPPNIVPSPKTVPPSGVQTFNDRTAGKHLMLKDEYFSSSIKKLFWAASYINILFVISYINISLS